MEILFWLLFGHALADFSLQSDTMAKGKNRHRKTDPPPGAKYQPMWFYWLTSHALIHGGIVGIITHIWWLGLLEAICHWGIDFFKCENKYGIHTDQGLHILCKIIWATIFIALR